MIRPEFYLSFREQVFGPSQTACFCKLQAFTCFQVSWGAGRRRSSVVSHALGAGVRSSSRFATVGRVTLREEGNTLKTLWRR